MNNLAEVQPERFTDADGWRWYNGEPGPNTPISVTTILSNAVANPKLSQWFKQNSEKKIEKVRTQTAQFGSDGHKYFELIVKGEPFEVPETHKPHVVAFQQWVAEHKVKALCCERPVVSEEYGFAGTADFMGEIDGELTLADWKTGRSYAITNGWQMASYRIAAIEQGLVPDTCGLMGVQIPRDTAQIKTFKYTHIDFVEHAFLCSLEVFKALHFTKLNKLGWKWLKERAV